MKFNSHLTISSFEIRLRQYSPVTLSMRITLVDVSELLQVLGGEIVLWRTDKGLPAFVTEIGISP